MRRERHDRIVGAGHAALVLDAGAAPFPPDRADRLVEFHARLHGHVERMGYAIHAADWLHHGRLHIDDGLEELRKGGGAAGEQLLERNWIERVAGIVIAAWPIRIAE